MHLIFLFHCIQRASDQSKKGNVDIPKTMPLTGKDLGLGDHLPLSFGKGGGFLTEEDEEEQMAEEEEYYKEGERQEYGYRFDQGRGRGRGGFQQAEEVGLDTAAQGDWVGFTQVKKITAANVPIILPVVHINPYKPSVYDILDEVFLTFACFVLFAPCLGEKLEIAVVL